eukprot:TRINITY_DN8737_c0_g1_i1.p1 TRINITY_DN8737_c0_g1~~TRINITY_DN8737_c0_g1_i1.p1  ORF type:complete len:1353 (+),score=232.75 TRINITY_DN8737_c0_g1_i1:96-4154(+)
MERGLEAILSSKVSKYLRLVVKNYGADRTQFRLTGGHCTMYDLELHEGAIQHVLKLPYLAVRSARVSQLSITISIAKLKKEPVQIRFGDIDISLEEVQEPVVPYGPLVDKLRQKKERKERKRAEAAKSPPATASQPKPDSAKSKIKKLIQRVLQGLRIELGKLAITITTRQAVTRLVVRDFSLATTDGEWKVVDLETALPPAPKDTPDAPQCINREVRVGALSVSFHSRSESVSTVLFDSWNFVVRVTQRHGRGFQCTAIHLIAGQDLKISATPAQQLLMLSSLWRILRLTKKKGPKNGLQNVKSPVARQSLQAPVQVSLPSPPSDPPSEEDEESISDLSDGTDSEPERVALPEESRKTVKELHFGATFCRIELVIPPMPGWETPTTGGQPFPGVTVVISGLEFVMNPSGKTTEVLLPYLAIYLTPGTKFEQKRFLLVPFVSAAQRSATAEHTLFSWPHLCRNTAHSATTSSNSCFSHGLASLERFTASIEETNRIFYRRASVFLHLKKTLDESGMKQQNISVNNLKLYCDSSLWNGGFGSFWSFVLPELAGLANADAASLASPMQPQSPAEQPKQKQKIPSRLHITVNELSLLVPANPSQMRNMREVVHVNFQRMTIENWAVFPATEISNGTRFIPTLPDGRTPPFSAAEFDSLLGSCPSKDVYRILCERFALSIVANSAEQQHIVLPVQCTIFLFKFPKKLVALQAFESIKAAMDQNQATILLEIWNSYTADSDVPVMKGIKEMYKSQRKKLKLWKTSLSLKTPKIKVPTAALPQQTAVLNHFSGLTLGIFVQQLSVELFYPSSQSLRSAASGARNLEESMGGQKDGTALVLLSLTSVSFTQLKCYRFIAVRSAEVATQAPRHSRRTLMTVAPSIHGTAAPGRNALTIFLEKRKADGIVSKETLYHIRGLQLTGHVSHLCDVLMFFTTDAPAFGCSLMNVMAYYSNRRKPIKPAGGTAAAVAKQKSVMMLFEGPKIFLLENLDDDTAVGLEVNKVRLWNTGAKKGTSDVHLGSKLADKLQKKSAWNMEMQGCAVLCRLTGEPSVSQTQPLQYVLIDTFDVRPVDAGTAATFVAQLMSDDDQWDEVPASVTVHDWLPPTVTIRVRDPNTYSHIRQIFRNLFADMAALKLHLSSVGIRRPKPLRAEAAHSGAQVDKKVARLEEKMCLKVSAIEAALFAVDVLLSHALCVLGADIDTDDQHTEEIRAVISEVRKIVTGEIGTAIGTIRKPLASGLLRSQAEEIHILRNQVTRLESDLRAALKAPPPAAPTLAQEPATHPETGVNGVTAKKELSFATLKEQNMLYKELVADISQVADRTEKDKKELERQNRELCALLQSHGITVPSDLQAKASR